MASRTEQMLSRQRRASTAPGSRPAAAALHDPGKARHYEEPPPDVEEEVAMAQSTGQMGASMLMGDPRLKQQLAALKRKSEKPKCSAMIGSGGGTSPAASSSPRAGRIGAGAPSSAKVVGQMSAKEVAEYLEKHNLLQLVNACANEALVANAPNPLLFMATALREKTGRSAPVGAAAGSASAASTRAAGTPTGGAVKQQQKPPGADEDVKWFYVDAKRQKVGPVSWEDLVTLHDEEKIELKTLVWAESLPQWTPLGDLVELSDEEDAGTPQQAAAAKQAATPVNGAGKQVAENPSAQPAKSKPPTRKKRLAVAAEAGAEEQTELTHRVIPKDAEAEAAISEASDKCVLLSGCTQEEYRTLVDSMFEVPAATGQTIIRQGEKGDNFYIVQSGEYNVFIDGANGGRPVKTYIAGDSFGELALLYNCPRAATITCAYSGTLWATERATFRAVLCTSKKDQFSSMADFLASATLFESLSGDQLSRLCEVVVVQEFSNGELIVRQGDVAEAVYLVYDGRVACRRRGASSTETFRLGRGACFGESALNDELPAEKRRRAADVYAEGDCAVVELQATEFARLLGGSLNRLAQDNFNRKVLAAISFSGVSLSSILSSSDMTKLLNALHEDVFDDGDQVIEEGAPGDTFYIIKGGVAVVSTAAKGELAQLTDGAYFGEMALLSAEPRKASVAAKGELRCLSLDRPAFNRLLGPLQERLSPEMSRRSSALDRIAWEDLEIRQTLGQGAFGQVKLVVHRPTSTPYALKAQYKGQVVATNQVANILNEKELMARCSHPFILKLAATFQDDHVLYMLLDLVQGGELFTLLSNTGHFPLPQAAFYAAIVASAFEYMHDRHLVYRDLKPENLLFDAQGYLKVIDFGFAKEVRTKTWTLCGTPEYLAPEIIMNEGHNQSADWWALGILCYEMLMGHSPFNPEPETQPDPMQIYQKILYGVLPKAKKTGPQLSREALDMITDLLVREPTDRLGQGKGGVSEIKDHGFFGSVNWKQLDKRKLQAPWAPEIADPLDCSNFEGGWEEVPDEHRAANTPETDLLFQDF